MYYNFIIVIKPAKYCFRNVHADMYGQLFDTYIVTIINKQHVLMHVLATVSCNDLEA